MRNAKRSLAAKRQVADATKFDDEHYPTFYGADFSNVRWIINLKFSYKIYMHLRAPSYGVVASTSPTQARNTQLFESVILYLQ